MPRPKLPIRTRSTTPAPANGDEQAPPPSESGDVPLKTRFAVMAGWPDATFGGERTWKQSLDPDPYGHGEVREIRPAPRDNSFIFRPRPEFPAFLRKSREAAGLSIRQAAPALGISPAYLSRLETGGPARQPSMDRLNKMAELYNIEKYVLFGEAGIELDKPDNLDLTDHTDADFEAVMLHDDLRPAMLTPEALNYFSPRMKRQILEVVRKACLHADPAALYQSILPVEAESE